MDKKEKERNILAYVYELDRYADVLDSEGPDFRIKRHAEAECFGVEVTQFHYSESNARLRAIPEYFDEIINESKYRHKDDKKELAVHDAVIIDAEGNEVSKTKCLLQKRPSIEDHVAMLHKVIRSKENKLPQYQHDLTHINLIVYDAEAGFMMFEKNQYYKHLFTDNLREYLYKTGFREIFLVTMLNDRWVYIPLKMILLIAEWYLFHGLIHECFPKRVRKYQHEFQTFFAQYMQYKTGNAYYTTHQPYRVEVIWANTGVMFDKPNNAILGHEDSPLSSNVIKPNLKGVTRFFKSKAFQTRLREQLQNYTFSTEFAFDVKKPITSLHDSMKSVVLSEVLEE
jgi:hypothetical protein